MCWFVTSNRMLARCVNEKSVARRTNVVFSSPLTSFCKLTKRGGFFNFFFCARGRADEGNNFFREDRHQFIGLEVVSACVNSLCVCAITFWPHLTLTWALLITHFHSPVDWRSSRMFIYQFFFFFRMKSDYGIIRSDCDINFTTSLAAASSWCALWLDSGDIIVHYKVHDSHNDAMINLLTTSYYFHHKFLVVVQRYVPKFSFFIAARWEWNMRRKEKRKK